VVGAIGLWGGVLTGSAVVLAQAVGGPLPAGPPVASALTVVGLLVAATGFRAARGALPRLSLAQLGAGAQLGDAAVSAAVTMDTSLLSDVVEVRRLRRLGRVRKRTFLRLGGRVGALLQAEIRRIIRRPGALGVWAGLALGQYAVAIVAPSVASVTQVLGAYLATKRLAGGLRTISRSRALRRSLGGHDLTLRLIHLVLPALGVIGWWLVTAPTSGGTPWILDAILLAGIVLAIHRAITRPPLSYSGVVMETPFGPIPMDLVRDLGRGPDLLAAVMLIRLLWELGS
jgi:hypothetical protein